jgi:hypothetical protein
MILNLTPHHFEELIKKGYSLDHIFLLKCIEQNEDLSEMFSNSLKISAIRQGLFRKGLITDQDKITLTGKELLYFLETVDKVKIVKKKIISKDFDEWWKTYPGTDTFIHKNKKFTGSRSLRQNKEACKLKFNKIIDEGEYTANQLIQALSYDVNQKKDNSVATNGNKLTYMQNSLTYLNQCSYEPFIELISQEIFSKPVSTNNGGTDI